MDGAPAGSLKYLLANPNATSQIDDDGVEIGVNGTVGGFSSVILTKQNMTVRFHDQNGTVLYTSYAYPRDTSRKDSDALSDGYIALIVLCSLVLVFVVLMGVYYVILHRAGKGTKLAQFVDNNAARAPLMGN